MSNSYNPMDYSLPGASVHGILQARILEGVVTSSSRISFQPRDQALAPPALAGRFFPLRHQGSSWVRAWALTHFFKTPPVFVIRCSGGRTWNWWFSEKSTGFRVALLPVVWSLADTLFLRHQTLCLNAKSLYCFGEYIWQCTQKMFGNFKVLYKC